MAAGTSALLPRIALGHAELLAALAVPLHHLAGVAPRTLGARHVLARPLAGLGIGLRPAGYLEGLLALRAVPLAPDGSFYVEVPADRLLHHQVLDSDRRVVGNQLTWIYPRPGETKSCVGCHENPHTTTAGNDPLASHFPPVKLLPNGHQFTYRAKAWFKGHLPPEIDPRTRTARAVNLLGR